MPVIADIAIGVLFGLAVIAGAVYLAVRPYLGPTAKPWMPDAKDNGHDRPRDWAA